MRSPWALAFQRLRRDRASIVAAVVIVMIAIFAALAPSGVPRIHFGVGTGELLGLLGEDSNLNGSVWSFLENFNINTAGFVIVGVFIVTAQHANPPQELYRDDWAFGEMVMVERYIPGKELTCAVLGDRVLDVIEIVPATRFYDYEAKYAAGGSKHLLPAQILPNVYQEVRRLSLAAHNALGCRGVSRADFRYDDRGTGELVCLEVNTQPGMTETSLVPELAAYAGITFDELVRWMVEDASTNR